MNPVLWFSDDWKFAQQSSRDFRNIHIHRYLTNELLLYDVLKIGVLIFCDT